MSKLVPTFVKIVFLGKGLFKALCAHFSILLIACLLICIQIVIVFHACLGIATLSVAEISSTVCHALTGVALFFITWVFADSTNK